jgi:hypothetical protein
MMAELEALEIHVMENTDRFKLYIDSVVKGVKL